MDTLLAPAGRLYAAPAIALGADTVETGEADEVVWWIVFVGFAYALALAWASWCRLTGGYPEISLGWTGFKVACKSAP